MRAPSLARQNQSPRYTVDYESAAEIGILLQGKPPFFVEEALKLRDLLEKDGKKVSILAFSDSIPQQEEWLEGVSVFSSKQISWSGKQLSPDVQSFMATQFDYLYCFAPAKARVFDAILAGSKARCRVGCYDGSKRNFYEVMIHLKETDNGEVLINEMLRYSRALAYV